MRSGLSPRRLRESTAAPRSSSARTPPVSPRRAAASRSELRFIDCEWAAAAMNAHATAIRRTNFPPALQPVPAKPRLIARFSPRGDLRDQVHRACQQHSIDLRRGALARAGGDDNRCLAGPADQGGQRLAQLASHAGQLRADALLPRRADQHPERRQAAPGVRVPDRGERVYGDRTDRGRRGHVSHHLVQPCLRGRRRHRERAVALQAPDGAGDDILLRRSEEHTSELQSLRTISYAVFCLKKKKKPTRHSTNMAIPKTYNELNYT